MQQTYVLNRPYQSVSWLRSGYTTSLTIFTLLMFLGFISIRQFNPPAAVPASAPPAEFSSGRALRHLAVIAAGPHSCGSAAHAEVRDYLIRELTTLGLKPEVQKTTVVGAQQGSVIPAATVENVLARLPGTATGPAAMLVAHYDSVSTSSGASDDGAAVAAMLETARALKSAAPLRNDVIFLFTDGEEIGLLGAKAFVDENPLVKEIAIVFNFEARGNAGPSIMFETSDQNGRLIKEFAKIAPSPIANSLSYEIYKRLPNDTDMSVFKKAGLHGFNFAFIDGINNYHTPLDKIENLDERSLQHQGLNALALAQHFGNLDLPVKQEPNAVYFNFLGATMIHYSQSFVMLLAALAVLLWVAVVWLGLKRMELSYGEMGLGFLATLVNTGLVWLLVTGLWWLLSLAQPDYLALQISPYHNGLYIASYVAFAVALTAVVYAWLQSRASVGSLTAGGLLWWLLLLVITSIYIPGSSYLFAWPLLFGLVGLASFFLCNEQQRNSLKLKVVLFACATPGMLLVVPLIYLMHISLMLQATVPTAVLAVLLFGSLLPLISLMTGPGRWILPGAAALAGCVLAVTAVVTSGFNSRHPKPDCVFYVLNADSGKAAWVSNDDEHDKWTSQFFDGKTNKGSVEEYVPLTYEGFLTSAAPSSSFEAPTLSVLDDTSSNGLRTLRLHVFSQRQASSLGIYVENTGADLKATVNGKSVEYREGTRLALRYYAAGPEGVELTLQLKQSAPLKLRLMDQTHGLPNLPQLKIKERTGDLMLSRYSYTDSTLVSRTFSF